MAVKQAFTADIAGFISKAQDRFDTVFRKTALEVEKRVVIRTPVDTGRARAGWGLAMQGKFTAVLANNVPYIVKLEYGHSKQAPAGMVRPTLAEFSNIVSVATTEAKAK
jgi:hypothetical protein